MLDFFIFGRKITHKGPIGPIGPKGPTGPMGHGLVDGEVKWLTSDLGGFSGCCGFSGPSYAGFSGSSSCHGFSGRAHDTACFTFTVSERDWTDVCMFIKEGFQVEASPGEILWNVLGEQDGTGRKMTESVMLSLVVNDDRTGKILITVSDGSTYDVTKKSLAYVPYIPGKSHPGYEHDDGLLWINTALGAFEAKLNVQKSKAIAIRDFSLDIPDDAEYIMYYDGHFLMYFDAKETFGCDETERGLAHDAAFAAVVAAEWRHKCLLRTTLPAGHQACGCENCRKAEEWQKFYEATVDTKPKPTTDA